MINLTPELELRFKEGGNNSLVEKKVSPFSDVSVELLDTKETALQPQIKISRFNNDANFSVRLKDTGGVFSVDKDKVSYQSDLGESRIYELPDDKFEFDTVISAKPASNVVEYALQHKNVVAIYQPALTVAEAVEGFYRPDDVVGSYAIYHDSKRDNAYKTGKVTHVYRPYIEDANLSKVWCELNIDLQSNLMTVTIPQDFLDTATYPLRLDPTFGFTDLGASDFSAIASRSYGSLFDSYTATTGDILASISVGAKYVTSSAAASLGVYSVTTNLPDAQLDTATATVDSTSHAWHTTASIGTAMSGSTEYCSAFYNGGSNNLVFAYDAGVAGDASWDTSAGLQATWTSAGTIARKFSIYSTYDAAGTPTVTDLDTDEDVYPGQTSATITGTNFEAAKGTGSVTISPTDNVADGDAETQTTSSWADTSVDITVVQGGLPFGAHYLFATNDSALTNSTGKPITFSSESGKANDTMVSVDPDGLVLTFTNLAIGDQIEIETASTNGGTVALNDDGTATVTGGSDPANDSFQARAWDQSEATPSLKWSPWATVNTGAGASSGTGSSSLSLSRNLRIGL